MNPSCLYSDDLFEKALLAPIHQGANRLFVVSGYASPHMVAKHFQQTKALNQTIEINLIAGMYLREGIAENNHIAFQQIQKSKEFTFECRYITSKKPVHAKVYSWFKDEQPLIGFVGSANYTQNAFSASMREVLLPCCASECRRYYDSLQADSLSCTDAEIEKFLSIVTIHQRVARFQQFATIESDDSTRFEKSTPKTLSLLDKRTEEVPQKSGLNWGQRPGREPNQAYINIPAPVRRSGFFPERSKVFTVLTDDQECFLCVRAQDGGKGLETPLNNSLLGKYFRKRLGLPSGAFVKKSHLLAYGRTNVDFYKMDDETYYLDFSVKNSPQN